MTDDDKKNNINKIKDKRWTKKEKLW